MRINKTPRIGKLLVISAVIGLGGCAKFSVDQGMGFVANVAQNDLRKHVKKIGNDADAYDVETRVKKLLKKPLTPGSAVQIALLNNRGLQASYNDLGISEARFVQATLPPNPTISIGRLANSRELEIERMILVNVLALLTLPTRKKIAEVRYRQAKLRAAEDTLKLAADTRQAFYKAVAARQKIVFLRLAARNTRTVSRLFKKLGESGAVNKLDQAREHVFYAELTAQLGKARLDYGGDKERLIRMMGLWGKKVRFRLPSRIARLPRRLLIKKKLEQEAIRRNIAIKIAKAELDATIKSYGLTNATRYINVLEVSGLSSFESAKTVDPATGEVEKEKASRRGIELEIKVPIFDFGQARKREAEETYKRSINRLAKAAVDVRSIARESYQRYRGAYTLARHYQRYVLPLRKTISDETLLRYNAMIVDVFPLLAEARQRINSNLMAISARRDFWLAAASLQAAIIGGGGAAAAGGDQVAIANPAGGAEH